MRHCSRTIASDVTVLRSDVNGGPAGGYAIALERFLESDSQHAWVLDDDMLPEPECLERLWVVAASRPGVRLRVPRLVPGGRVVRRLAVVVRLPGVSPDHRAGRPARRRAVLVGRGHRVPAVEDPAGGIPDPGGGRRRGPPRFHPPWSGRAGVEVLLRGPQHALRAPLREDAAWDAIPATCPNWSGGRCCGSRRAACSACRPSAEGCGTGPVDAWASAFRSSPCASGSRT